MLSRFFGSNRLRYWRLVTAGFAILFLNLGLYSYNDATSVWLWGVAIFLALVFAIVNYLLYRELKKRPHNDLYFSVKQGYIVFMLVSLITFCVIIFKLVTLQDITDRLILFGFMVLLLFSDVMTTRQLRRYLKSR